MGVDEGHKARLAQGHHQHREGRRVEAKLKGEERAIKSIPKCQKHLGTGFEKEAETGGWKWHKISFKTPRESGGT